MAENQQNNSVNRAPSELTEALSGISKRCRGKCGHVKPVGRFSKHAGNKDGLQDICKECQSDFMRDYNARKSMERKAQLTAGDIELDPKPAPLLLAMKKVKKKVLKSIKPVEFKPDPEKVKLPESVAKPSHVYEPRTPREVVEDERMRRVSDDILKFRCTEPLFTQEEKALIMASLDRHIAIVEGIIEKLSR